MPLVTSARVAQWNGRGRDGDGADRQPVERSKPCVGHGGYGDKLAGCAPVMTLLLPFALACETMGTDDIRAQDWNSGGFS